MYKCICITLMLLISSVSANMVQNGEFNLGSDYWSSGSAWGEYFYTDNGDTIASIGGWGSGWGNAWSNTYLRQVTDFVFESDKVYQLEVVWREAPGENAIESIMLAIDGISSSGQWVNIVSDWYITSYGTVWNTSTLVLNSAEKPEIAGAKIGVGISLTSSIGTWLHIDSVRLVSEVILPGYVSCRQGKGGDLTAADPADLSITVDISRTGQTISGFGASDCWSAQYVGNWPIDIRNKIADLLFDTHLDEENNPVGIGLSIWRMNLGAGSSRQGNIYDHWRQADNFYNNNFTGYDWGRCVGQRNFIQMARARGVEHFIAFCNSPPISMTKNGNAFCDPGVGDTNLASDKRDEFAVYLSDVIEHFEDYEDITFQAVSPVNEPEWDWNENSSHPGYSWQEGCRYSNKEIMELVKVISSEFINRGLDTKIEICESGEIVYQYQNGSFEGNHISQFFDTLSSNYIGDTLSGEICGHSYWSDSPLSGLVYKRQILSAELDKYNLEYNMTEYCILGDYGSGRDLGIDPALHIARTIHYDLTVANVKSWQWWTAISPYDYKDGLVYCDKNDNGGNYYESKMLWAMGNFSRFIRPGMKRIEIQRSDNASPTYTQEDLMISGFYHSQAGSVVSVFVNRAYEDRLVKIDYRNLPSGKEINCIIPYVTSENDNLRAYRRLEPGDVIAIPSRAIVTLVGINTIPGDNEPDGDVDIIDFSYLSSEWMNNYVMMDLEQLAANWLKAK